MDNVNYMEHVERQVEAIRDAALQKVRQVYPDATFVVDNRTLDDYSYRQWDYPGAWYVGFQLPEGFRKKEALIDAIAEETIKYLEGQKRGKSRFRNPFRKTGRS